MSNKQEYQETFSQLHSTRPIRWEDMEERAGREAKRRPARILAAVGVAAALIAALAASAVALDLFSLRQLLLPGKQQVAKLDEHGARVPGESEYVDAISLAGYMDSPSSQALAEWNVWLNEYDVEGAARTADEEARRVGQRDPELEKYTAYQVYNREMAAKLEEILDKYGLEPKGRMHEMATREEMTARLGGDFLGPVNAGYGYMYDDGCVGFDASIPRPGTQEVIDLQFHRSVKTSLEDALLNIRDAESYEQWEYKTACGETVLLCLGPSKGLVFADFEDCFISLNVLSGTQEVWMPEWGQTPITRADMEYIADSVDFSLLHPVVPYAQTRGAGADGEAQEYVIPAYEAATGTALPGEFLPVLLETEDGGFFNTAAGETMTLSDYTRRRRPEGTQEPVEFYYFAPIDLDGDEAAEISGRSGNIGA